MKYYNIVILFLFSLFYFSCKKNQENQLPDSRILLGESFLKSELIEYSYLLELYKNYLIALNFRGNDVIRIYDTKTSDLIFSGVEFGEGPSQILMPISISLDKEKGNILIYDVAKLRFVEINIEDLLGGNEIRFEKSTSVPHLGDNVYPVFQYGMEYLGITWNLEKYVFSFNSNSETLDTLVQYQKVDSKTMIPDIMYGLQYDGRYCLDVKSNIIVKGSLHSNIISTIDLNSGLENEIINFESIVYTDRFNSERGRFEWDEQRNYCYVSVKITDDFYYLLYSGENMDSVSDVLTGKEIHVINKNDNQLTKFYLDYEISDFSIDEEDRVIYGINFTLDNPILKFSY